MPTLDHGVKRRGERRSVHVPVGDPDRRVSHGCWSSGAEDHHEHHGGYHVDYKSGT
jgi:hypothetical protein